MTLSFQMTAHTYTQSCPSCYRTELSTACLGVAFPSKRHLISIEKRMPFPFGPDSLSKLSAEGVKILADGLIS